MLGASGETGDDHGVPDCGMSRIAGLKRPVFLARRDIRLMTAPPPTSTLPRQAPNGRKDVEIVQPEPATDATLPFRGAGHRFRR